MTNWLFTPNKSWPISFSFSFFGDNMRTWCVFRGGLYVLFCIFPFLQRYIGSCAWGRSWTFLSLRRVWADQSEQTRCSKGGRGFKETGAAALDRMTNLMCFMSIKTRKHILVVTQNKMKVRIIFCCILLDTTECGSSSRWVRSPRPPLWTKHDLFLKLINCMSSSLSVMLNFML